jgi:hypothetical protein
VTNPYDPTTATMTDADQIWATNEWMRRYIENPDEFMREFEAVQQFTTALDAGKVPDYGEVCVAYMRKLLAERDAA